MELNDDDKQKIRESLPKIHNLVARNLIKAITEGKIPTDRQLEMLKTAVAMPENDTSTPPASADFKLDAVIVPEGHQEAADFWGVSRKTLTRWKEAGKKAEDPCPYRTAPEQMVDWYKRVFAKPVPDAIPQTLERLRPASAPAASAPTGKLPHLDMSQFKPEDYNYDGMLMSMRTLMLAQQYRLNEAMASGEKSQTNQATEDLRQTVEALRKLEKDSGKILEQQGLTLRSADVRAAVIEAHQFIPLRFKAELKRMVRVLPGITMTDRELDEWAERTVDSACASLVKTDLTKAA